MTKEFWVNLPVKNIEKSKNFFTQLGFSLSPVPGNSNDAASMVVGSKNVVVMLFEEPAFKGFAANKVADANKNTEVLFSIDAENRDEVDKFAIKVSKAGGTIYAAPGEKDGWMYGCGFADPDGHRWSVLYMDTSKMPKG